ncbi:transposable element Tcb1 transposase [Trichonephila clavipes]|nr:transposable element Tcb1 transposase [Trichonephila clavipes]
MWQAEAGFDSKFNVIRFSLSMFTVHPTINSANACAFQLKINEAMDTLRILHSASNNVEWPEWTPNDREIGSRVERNHTTVIRICDSWMQEGTMDRNGRSHLPQCTTSGEDRQIVRKAVRDSSVTSRTISQHIESVTHHPVSARTIRHRLQQNGLSARRSLLGLPLTQNHRRVR